MSPLDISPEGSAVVILLRSTEAPEESSRCIEVGPERQNVRQNEAARLPEQPGETELDGPRCAELVRGRDRHGRMRADLRTEVFGRQPRPLVQRDLIPQLLLHQCEVSEVAR